MIKDRVGRQRYILFSVQGDASRRDVIRAINEAYRSIDADGDAPWLTVYTGSYGIVRCSHTKKEETIRLLNGISNDFSLSTVQTSGTIKTLKQQIAAQ
jgi:RNase P/RNase MRP subunit POP5